MTPPASLRRAAPWAALALLLLFGPAQGHIAGSMGYATVSLHDGTVRYSLTLGPDALAAAGGEAAGLRLAPRGDYATLADLVARKVGISANGMRCEPVPGTVTPPTPDRANAIVIIDYACSGTPRELVLRDDLSDVLGNDYHTLVRVEALGSVQQYTLERDRREARLAVAAPSGGPAPEVTAGSGVFAFFRLGIEHILTGVDHLLFVLALVLGGGGIGSLFGVITAFTVAHSIALAVAVLGAASPPSWIVEPVIALSIVYVAVENIFLKRTASWRWAVGFAFGLVHGFGFAGALLDLDLPPAALAGGLVSFNLGVEAGQAAVIAAFLPVLIWFRRAAWERRAVTALSALVLVAGLAFLVDRVLAAANW
ncbi:HupE/UreJ family protein [Bradyrhizobium frederickii]|uniref:HupE/UreJ family protein n=1 Tax=Bradyrhizobium frederickii TaxID=2560054 RepID=A0A4Y9P2L7_9BRAD|nr:HupE/UreJ family protein [Bradyrhizobium frederickii]TFV74601.1 HupE/UreJ family protein [Bradyrhizobium frederickii]